MMRHSQPQPQPLSVQRGQVANYRVAKKEGFIKIEREEKRKMGKRKTETKRKEELNTCKARVFPTCLL